MSKRDYYEVLEVSREAGLGEIEKSYRKMAMKYHPDRNQGDPGAEEKLKEINEAFAVLSDDEKRSKFDRFGHEGLSGMDFSGFDINDLFGDLFGSIFGGGGPRRPRGQDLAVEAELTFEESAFGVEKTLEVPYREVCSGCEGSGAKAGTKPEKCHACRGRGEVRVQQGFFTMVRTCPECQGAGALIKDPCPDCEGQGTVKSSKEMEVAIPAGVRTGHVIRMRGKGNESLASNGVPGDLDVHIQVKEHLIFEREEDDVICEIPISFPQAALGTSLDVPTLDGLISMKIPAGTQSGTSFRLRRKGIERLQGYGRGDQLVRIVIEVPTKLSKEQKELLESFDELVPPPNGTPARQGFLDSIKNLFS